MNTALLVIGVQLSFVQWPYPQAKGLDAFLERQNRLIEQAGRAGVPVVRVLYEEPGGPQQPFSPAPGHVRPMDGLPPFDAAHSVRKTQHRALVGTGLDVWPVERGLRRLVISGIRSEQCCETTTRHASDLGWQSVFVPEATMTWDITLDEGSRILASEIQRRTEAVLRHRFAEVRAVEEALRDADEH